EEEKKPEKVEYVFDNGAMKVVAKLSDPTAIPDEAELRVTGISEGESFKVYMSVLSANAEKEFTSANSLLYDVAFIGKDKENNVVEYEPTVGSVTLTFSFLNNQLETIGVQKAEDLLVSHMSLSEAVLSNVKTSLDASGFGSSDVKYEPVAGSFMVDTGAISFTVNHLSAFSFSSKQEVVEEVVEEVKEEVLVEEEVAEVALAAMNIEPGNTSTFVAILGDAHRYGIVARYFEPAGDLESAFAVETINASSVFKSTKPQGGGNPNPGVCYIGSGSMNGNRIEVQTTASNLYIYTTDAVKNTFSSQDMNHTVFDTSTYTSAQINSIVENMIKYATGSSGIMMNETNQYDASMFYKNGRYEFDIASQTTQAGTYYINCGSDFANFGNYSIKLAENQNIVFNIPDTSVNLGSYTFNYNGVEYNVNGNQDLVAQQVAFNCPNATSVVVGQIDAIVLAPKASVTNSGVCGGWILADSVRIAGSEFHNNYQNMPSILGIAGGKNWVDKGNEDKRPASITINLYRDGVY
ncbi:MAG: hypothetical protein HUJ56_08225, partial [Erysipelotrichaceae bacterium]|nr:hypothetical protein [Erysipelotrichaceae bacterium]